MCEWSESSWTFSRRQQRKQTQHLKWERLLRHSPWHSAGPYVSSAACPPAGSPSYCCHYQDNLQKHETEYHVNLGLLSFFTVCRLQATTHKLDHSSSSSSSNLFWLVSDRLLSWRSIHPLSCVRNERSAVNQFTLVAAHQRHDGDEQKQHSRSFSTIVLDKFYSILIIESLVQEVSFVWFQCCWHDQLHILHFELQNKTWRLVHCVWRTAASQCGAAVSVQNQYVLILLVTEP